MYDLNRTARTLGTWGRGGRLPIIVLISSKICMYISLRCLGLIVDQQHDLLRCRLWIPCALHLVSIPILPLAELRAVRRLSAQ